MCAVPATLVINAVAYGVHTTSRVKISLAILLAGVGVATVSEVHLRALGIVYGILAVISTAVCQIWQGTKQKEFGLSATQLQAVLAPWMSAQALATAVVTEVLLRDDHDDTPVAFFLAALSGEGEHGEAGTLWIVLGTCFLALGVNLCSFGLIGQTSAITYQVRACIDAHAYRIRALQGS